MSEEKFFVSKQFIEEFVNRLNNVRDNFAIYNLPEDIRRQLENPASLKEPNSEELLSTNNSNSEDNSSKHSKRSEEDLEDTNIDIPPIVNNNVLVYWHANITNHLQKNNKEIYNTLKPKEITVKLTSFKMSSPSEEDLYEIYQDDKHFVIHDPIDFVLVCEKEKLKEANLTTYLKKLINSGFEHVILNSLSDSNLSFILLHGVPTALQHFAHIYSIEQKFQTRKFQSEIHTNLKIFNTDLTIGSSTLRNRNIEFFQDLNTPTPSERVMIAYKVLQKPCYPDLGFALHRLIRNNEIICAFPLHDGSCDWTNSGVLHYRQALAHYWSSMWSFFKYQPLDIIEKYFGAETVMYFTVMGFYNVSILPLAALSLSFFLIGIFVRNDELSQEICNSDMLYCPMCRNNPSNCQMLSLSKFCNTFKATIIIDNFGSLVTSICILLWAVVAMAVWIRNEVMYKMRWRITNLMHTTYIRQQYEDTSARDSFMPGMWARFSPIQVKILKTLFSWLICLCLILCMLAAIFTIAVIRSYIIHSCWNSPQIVFNKYSHLWSTIPTAIITVIIVHIFKIYLPKVCYWLTVKENPKTQDEFDKAFITKWVILSIINVFSPLFYFAFYKPALSPTPYDIRYGSILNFDMCYPSGCLLPLAIQIIFMYIGESTLIKYIASVISDNYRKKKQKKYEHKNFPLWEKDYYLLPTNRYYLCQYYIDFIIKHGLMIFFGMPFPIGPLWTLIDNAFALRFNAYRLLHKCRRPVARRGQGIGIWRTILFRITWISVITNAFLITITSEFVRKAQFRSLHKTLVNYTSTLMSEYAIKDILPENPFDVEICHYRGISYPSKHPLKYKRTYGSWKEWGIRMMLIMLSLHIVAAIAGVISYAIPKTPQSVKEFLRMENQQLNEIRAQKFADRFKKRVKKPNRNKSIRESF